MWIVYKHNILCVAFAGHKCTQSLIWFKVIARSKSSHIRIVLPAVAQSRTHGLICCINLPATHAHVFHVHNIPTLSHTYSFILSPKILKYNIHWLLRTLSFTFFERSSLRLCKALFLRCSLRLVFQKRFLPVS